MFNLLDGLVELDLGISRSEVADALGVHESDLLFSTGQEPEDEVWVKVAGLEEADAASLAQVAEQVELLGPEEVGIAVVEGL